MSDQPKPNQDFEINLLDVAIVLAKHKKLIIVAPIIAAIISAIIAFQSPDIYTADTTFMPPKQASSISSEMSSLGSLGSLSGILGGGGGGIIIGGQNDIYVAVLKSRTIQDHMISRFKLLSVFKTMSQESARKSLNGMTDVKVGKDGLIVVSVTDADPKRATMLANGYVEELRESNNQLAITEASQNRLFLEAEFLKAKNALGSAEADMKQLQEKTGLITVGPQIAALQTMINTTERQLADMSVSSTPNNPDYIKTRQKLANLQAEIGKAKSGQGYVTKAPERVLDFTRKTRNLKYAEALYQMALQQLTLAKVNEAKAGASIQVVDRAVVPEHKSGPFRSRIVMIAVAAALFIAVVLAFMLEAYERSKQNKESQTQFRIIKNHLGIR
ncbi:MAG: Wzz/FepE/Etk N-terminal domain-containing protein [Chlorobiaceae bacterium]